MDENHLQKLLPLLEKNKGNLSAAVRDAIDLAGLALESKGTVEEAAEFLKNEKEGQKTREELIQSGDYLLMDPQAVSWLINNSSGRLVDEDIIHEFINPYRINTMSELSEYLNRYSREIGWNISISLCSSEDIDPESATMTFYDGNRDLREYVVMVVAMFMGRWMNLDVETVYRKSNSTTLYLKRFEGGDLYTVPPGVRNQFGFMDETYREIERKPEFWKILISLYKNFKYQRINLDKDFFEAFVAEEVPDIKKYFEIMVGRQIHEIPLSDLIPLFKSLVMPSSLVTDIEASTEPGREYIKIRHDYSNEKAISKIVKLFSDLFTAGWHRFNVKSVSNLIIFEFNEGRAK